MSNPRVTTPARHGVLRTTIKIALVAAAAYALWRWVDWARVGASLLAMSTGGVLLAIALASVDRVLMGFKWRQLVRAPPIRDEDIEIVRVTKIAPHIFATTVVGGSGTVREWRFHGMLGGAIMLPSDYGAMRCTYFTVSAPASGCAKTLR